MESFNYGETLFLLLNESMNIVYSSKGVASLYNGFIKNINLKKYIENGILGQIYLDKYLIHIEKLCQEKQTFYFLQVQYTDKKNEVDNFYKDKLIKLNNKIEQIRDKLNRLMKEDYLKAYPEVLKLSMRLDCLINEYMCLKEKMNI